MGRSDAPYAGNTITARPSAAGGDGPVKGAPLSGDRHLAADAAKAAAPIQMRISRLAEALILS